MPAPPLKTEISDTYPNPSNAVARGGFAKLWEVLFGAGGLLGATGDAADARAALGVDFGEWTQIVGAPTASSGAFTNAQYVLRYKRIGNTVWFNIVVTIITNGTAAASIRVALPFSTVTESAIAGRESQATGAMCVGTMAGPQLTIFKYDNTYPGGSGYRIALNGAVEVA